jgi:hypothetical protein
MYLKEEALQMNASYYELIASERLREARSLYAAVNRPDHKVEREKTERRAEPNRSAVGWGWYHSLGRLLWAR